MTTPQIADLPSSRKLIRATLVAIVAAAAILVTIVLPAEYGLDPLGTGRALGIFRPRVAVVISDEPPSSSAPVSASAILLKSPAAYRTDEMTLKLESGEGAEIKATMRRGERFVFTWTSQDGAVDFDMHGEAVNVREETVVSYWKDEEKKSGHGAFEAPFDGHHGWFWQNLNPWPVTVRLRTSGFYEQVARVGAN
jgi:hypothetical protein